MLLSGTSMATAVTTGSVALLLEANRAANYYPAHPSLTPNAVKAVLQYTSVGIHDDAGLEYNLLRKGAGSLNAKGAIDLGRTDRHVDCGREVVAHLDTQSMDDHWRRDARVEPGM